ncbi:MAG: hypothetical protein JWP30_1171 [Homoserinimonas sp.]|nr:hypothetical protein [Homoserinimonas sp.]
MAVPQLAHAEGPVRLGDSDIYDSTGVTDGRTGEIEQAFSALYDQKGIQLVVVFVDSFTGVADPADWSDATANLNALGNDDVLLAIAVEDRNYSVSYPPSFSLSESDTLAVEADYIEPALRNNDWAGAAIAAAEGYTEAGKTSFAWLPILGFLALAIVGTLLFFTLRRKRTNKQVEQQHAHTQAELEQRAGTLLVQLDDSLKTSEQELGFAVAQFGEPATAPFAAALQSARAAVMEAFSIKQQLDDAFPETDEQKRAMTARIIELCEQADATLDDQADAFDELRQLEKTAPDALAATRAAAQQQAARLATARQTLGALQTTYSPAALASVVGNPQQAEELLEFVAEASARADTALAEGKPSSAAVNVRAAQASVGQITQLIDAIQTASADLADASARLDAATADVAQDLAAALALPPTAALAASVAEAESTLQAVSAGDAARNPVASLARLQEADNRLDQILAAVRDEQERVQRAQARLDTALTVARSKVSMANDFITTRRGSIGETARTRAAEAGRHLQVAVSLVTTDPIAALAEAESASSLADNALHAAQADFGSYSSPGYGRGSSGADLGGILTGMIIGSLGSGGFNGGGSLGGSAGGFGGGASRRSGSFGGSSRRSSSGGGSRRSSGGRF